MEKEIVGGIGFWIGVALALGISGCATTPEEEMANRLQTYVQQCGSLTYDQCLQRKLVEEQIATARANREDQLGNALRQDALLMQNLQRKPAAVPMQPMIIMQQTGPEPCRIYNGSRCVAY